MNDATFLAALEGGTLHEEEFGHAGHVRAGYLYLRSMDYAAALVKLRTVIRNFATARGKAERYHETITVAYLTLIQEQMVHRGDFGSWSAFAQANGELLRPDALSHIYPSGQLSSDLARRIFVLPRLS